MRFPHPGSVVAQLDSIQPLNGDVCPNGDESRSLNFATNVCDFDSLLTGVFSQTMSFALRSNETLVARKATFSANVPALSLPCHRAVNAMQCNVVCAMNSVLPGNDPC